MKRIACGIVLLGLLLLLSSCGAKEQKVEGKPEALPVETPTEQPEPEKTDPEKEQPEKTEQQDVFQPFRLKFETEEEKLAMICGDWVYVNSPEGEKVSVTMTEDGWFHGYQEDEAAVNGCYEFVGNWKLEPRDDMDVLYLTTEDPQIELGFFPSLGDYRVGIQTICDGDILTGLTQLNNGDGYFSYWFDDFTPILRKVLPDKIPMPEEQRKSDSFLARCWKVEYGADGRCTLWLDPLEDGAEETVASPYRIHEDADLRCGPSIFERHAYLAEVETNENGEIVILNYYVDPLEDEEPC